MPSQPYFSHRGHGADRSHEFFSCTKSFRTTAQKTQTHQDKPSQFCRAASELGRRFTSVQNKMSTLRQRLHERGRFENPIHKINELTVIINKEINFLDKEVTRMGKKLKQTQSSIFGSVGPQNKRHQEEVLKFLQHRLKLVSVEAHDLLHDASETMKKTKKLDARFGCQNASTMTAPSVLRNRRSAGFSSSSSSQDWQVLHATDQDPMQEQLQELIPPPNLRQQRYQAARNMEESIKQTGALFKRMHDITMEQHETIIEINDNIQKALPEIQRGEAELLKYFEIVSGNRSLIIKIFLVLIVLMIIVTKILR